MAACDPLGSEFVEQELLRAWQLLQLLEKEKSVLADNNVEALLAITPKKSNLVASFLTARQQLQRALAAQGQASDEVSIRQWLKNLRLPGIARQRERLIELQQSAREINQTNGLLIARLSSCNQAALSALRGPQASGLYGPNGQRMHAAFGGVG